MHIIILLIQLYLFGTREIHSPAGFSSPSSLRRETADRLQRQPEMPKFTHFQGHHGFMLEPNKVLQGPATEPVKMELLGKRFWHKHALRL